MLLIVLTVLFGGFAVVAALGHNGDGEFAPSARGKGGRI